MIVGGIGGNERGCDVDFFLGIMENRKEPTLYCYTFTSKEYINITKSGYCDNNFKSFYLLARI